MWNPTGGKIRRDSEGQGHWGASRGTKRHKGVDFECEPGQPVYSPITGKVVRTARPYAGDEKYSGVVVENECIRIKMFYLHPIKRKIGKQVFAGDRIGTAQDISKKYPDGDGEYHMKPHVHLEISSVDPMLFINMP